MKKVIINFRSKTDAQLLTFAQQILQRMTGNDKFLNPDPALTVLEAAVLDFTNKLSAMDGNQEHTEQKDQSRAALEKVLRMLGNYVNDHSNDDVAVKLSSGFELSKDGGPVGPLDKVKGFQVTPGHMQATVSCDKDDHARTYIWEITTAPVTDASVWTTAPSTTAHYTFEGLKSGTEYSFRGAAVGSHPKLTYSDVVSSYVN